MALNTKIQFRRGYSQDYDALVDPTINNRPIDDNNKWKSTDTLYEGEIGYEIDTGKFKIGKYINGTLGTWGNLPYAGGSALTAGSGIILELDEADNAYTIYSYITGISGGQNGITFSTHQASEILTGENGEIITGTYYQIALSDKLETFHDSNISVSGNYISSTSNGITISGFENSTISLNPGGGSVQHSGVDIRNLFLPPNTNITVTEDVGGLTKGTVLTNASGIADVLRIMLEKVFEPTLYSSPSVGISTVSPSRYVISSSFSNTFTLSYSSGQIRGTGLGSAWNPNAVQTGAAGSLSSFLWTEPGGTETNIGTSTSKSVSVTLSEGDNIFRLKGNYNENTATVVNSAGQTAQVQPLSAGTTAETTRTVVGYWPLYYGVVSANNNIPTSSSDFTSLTAVDATTRPYYIVNSAGLTIPAGTKKIIIAVPSGWNDFGSGITIINDANLPETYSLTTISNTIGSYTKNYFVHYYIPAAPFAAETKHIISVS